ncbi:hypothetical protein [Thermus thalpophilus]|uniref:hypothetical protein n=1 Tax=Thermus thalpophilus TaxID=2908147 RepID=UPI001FAA89D3|nr:hypothetical protein [Thermus thalpophilus]
MVEGKTLRGSRTGQSPQARLWWVLALHLRTTLAQVRGGRRRPSGGFWPPWGRWATENGSFWVRGKKAALEAFSFHPLSALKFLGLYAAE